MLQEQGTQPQQLIRNHLYSAGKFTNLFLFYFIMEKRKYKKGKNGQMQNSVLKPVLGTSALRAPILLLYEKFKHCSALHWQQGGLPMEKIKAKAMLTNHKYCDKPTLRTTQN